MYDAKKEESIRDKQLQYDCIGDRSYFYTYQHSNMLNIKESYVPVETVIREFK